MPGSRRLDYQIGSPTSVYKNARTTTVSTNAQGCAGLQRDGAARH